MLAWVPGVWEIAIVAVVILLLFGSRLPGVMRSLGQGITEFKKGVQGIEDKDKDGKDRSNADADQDTARRS